MNGLDNYHNRQLNEHLDREAGKDELADLRAQVADLKERLFDAAFYLSLHDQQEILGPYYAEYEETME